MISVGMSLHDPNTSFDRIVVIENVTPNTDYTVSFVHRAGVIYFDVNGGYQSGGQTLAVTIHEF